MLAALYCLFILLAVASAMRPEQAYGVQGKLMCGQKPATNVKVKLFDKDTGMDPDDLMAEVSSGGDGTFILQGTENEMTKIDPELYIYHGCNDGIKPGQREVKIILPKQYIAEGKVPKTWFPLGVLNLEAEYTEEKRHLIG